jgi:hypothetical protein
MPTLLLFWKLLLVMANEFEFGICFADAELLTDALARCLNATRSWSWTLLSCAI